MTTYTLRPGAQSYGHDIGILLIACANPFPPGDVGNASTYRYPVLYETIHDVTIDSLIGRGDTSMLPSVIAAARRLEAAGVRAITSDCGYMLRFQQDAAAAFHIPVLLSSLLQLPFIAATLGPAQSIGILCANSARLTPDLIALAFPNPTRAIHIHGMQNAPAFRSAILEEQDNLDTDAVEREVVAEASALVQAHPDCGALLLECSNLPPYAAAIQFATDRPVFDFLTMIDHARAATRRHRYTGAY